MAHNFDDFLNAGALNRIAFETSGRAMPNAVHTRLFPDGGIATVPTPLSMSGTFRILDGRTEVRAGLDGQIGGSSRGGARDRIRLFAPTTATFTNEAKKVAVELFDEDLAAEGIAPSTDPADRTQAASRLQARAARAVNAAQLNHWEWKCLTKLWGTSFNFTGGAFTATQDSGLPSGWNPGSKAFEARDFEWSVFASHLYADMRKKTKGAAQARGPMAMKWVISPELALNMLGNRILNGLVPVGDDTAGFSITPGAASFPMRQLAARLMNFDGVGEVLIADHITDNAEHQDDAEDVGYMAGSGLGFTVMLIGGEDGQSQEVANQVTVQQSAMVRTVYDQKYHGMRRNPNNDGWLVEADVWQGFNVPVTAYGQTFYG